MPEAAVDENNLAMTREDDVWSARKVAPVQAVAIAQCMHEPANQHLWFGVRAADSRHAPLALLGGKDVRHRRARDRPSERVSACTTRFITGGQTAFPMSFMRSRRVLSGHL